MLTCFATYLSVCRFCGGVLGVARRTGRGRSIFIMSTLSRNPAMGSFDCFGFGNSGKLNTTRGKEAPELTKGSNAQKGLGTN